MRTLLALGALILMPFMAEACQYGVGGSPVAGLQYINSQQLTLSDTTTVTALTLPTTYATGAAYRGTVYEAIGIVQSGGAVRVGPPGLTPSASVGTPYGTGQPFTAFDLCGSGIVSGTKFIATTAPTTINIDYYGTP